MKNLKQILSIFLVAVLMLSLQHCELFDLAKPKSELDKLPPATQEGKSTFGCLINGKAWYTFNYNNVKADYQLGSLGFGATVYNPTEGIGFDLTEETNDPPLSIGTYSLLNTDQYKPGVSVFKSISCLYGGGQQAVVILPQAHLLLQNLIR